MNSGAKMIMIAQNWSESQMQQKSSDWVWVQPRPALNDIFTMLTQKSEMFYTVDSRRAIEIVQLQTLAWAWAGGLASSLQASRFGISAYVGGRTTAWLQISAKAWPACILVGLINFFHPCFMSHKLDFASISLKYVVVLSFTLQLTLSLDIIRPKQ